MFVLMLLTAFLFAPSMLDQSSWPEGTRAALEELESELGSEPDKQVGLVVVGNPGHKLASAPPAGPRISIQL